MIRRPLAALAALFAPLMTANGRGVMVPVGPAPVMYHPARRPSRGPGRRRSGRRVPRVAGIAHPPTARLRACGHWGRR